MRSVEKYERAKIIKPELFELVGGGALAQQHKDVERVGASKRSQRLTKSENRNIREPQNCRAQNREA